MTNLIELETAEQREAGYWKSPNSNLWYEKSYKKPYRDYKAGEMKIYNWTPVDDEKAIELLEEGFVPSFQGLWDSCGHDKHIDYIYDL